jgi:hypothetical protein
MDPQFGPIAYPQPQPGEMQLFKPYSEATGELIDTRVRDLVKEAYARTLKLLTEKKDGVTRLAERLLEKEVLTQVRRWLVIAEPLSDAGAFAGGCGRAVGSAAVCAAHDVRGVCVR